MQQKIVSAHYLNQDKGEKVSIDNLEFTKKKKVVDTYSRISDGEVTEIAAAFSGAAIGEARCDILEVGLAGEDIVAEGSELRRGGVPGGVADNTALRILPGRLASGALVFDEYVRRHHFFRRH
nr:hypothetical protein Iba_chr05aCG7930 [Ipomoea batatas]